MKYMELSVRGAINEINKEIMADQEIAASTQEIIDKYQEVYDKAAAKEIPLEELQRFYCEITGNGAGPTRYAKRCKSSCLSRQEWKRTPYILKALDSTLKGLKQEQALLCELIGVQFKYRAPLQRNYSQILVLKPTMGGIFRYC